MKITKNWFKKEIEITMGEWNELYDNYHDTWEDVEKIIIDIAR